MKEINNLDFNFEEILSDKKAFDFGNYPEFALGRLLPIKYRDLIPDDTVISTNECSGKFVIKVSQLPSNSEELQ